MKTATFILLLCLGFTDLFGQVIYFECPMIDDELQNSDENAKKKLLPCLGCKIDAGPTQTICLTKANSDGIQLIGKVTCNNSQYDYVRWCAYPPNGAPPIVFSPSSYSLTPKVLGPFVPGKYLFGFNVICGSNVSSDLVTVFIYDNEINIVESNGIEPINDTFYVCSTTTLKAEISNNASNEGYTFWYINPASDLDFKYEINNNSITISSKKQHSVCDNTIELTARYFGESGCNTQKKVFVKFCASEEQTIGQYNLHVCIKKVECSVDRLRLTNSNEDCNTIKDEYIIRPELIPFAGCDRKSKFELIHHTADKKPVIDISYYDLQNTSIRSVLLKNLCVDSYYHFRLTSEDPSDKCPCAPIHVDYFINTHEIDFCPPVSPTPQCLQYCDITPNNLSFSLAPTDNVTITWAFDTEGKPSQGMYFSNPNDFETELLNIPDNTYIEIFAILKSALGCELSYHIATIWPENLLNVTDSLSVSCDNSNYIFFADLISSNYLDANSNYINNVVHDKINLNLLLVESPPGYYNSMFSNGSVSYHPSLFFTPYQSGQYRFLISSNVMGCANEKCYIEEEIIINAQVGNEPVFAGADLNVCNGDTAVLNGSHNNGNYKWNWSIEPNGPIFTNPHASSTKLVNLIDDTIHYILYTVSSTAHCSNQDQLIISTTSCDECIVKLNSVDVSSCDGSNGLHYLMFDLSYENAPSGLIVVEINNINYEIVINQSGSPQVIYLPNLVANGEINEVLVYFFNNPECRIIFEYQSPESCLPCGPYSMGCNLEENYVCILDNLGHPISSGECGEFISANWYSPDGQLIHQGECASMDIISQFEFLKIEVYHVNPDSQITFTFIFDISECEGRNNISMFDYDPTFINDSNNALTCTPNPNNGNFILHNHSLTDKTLVISNSMGIAVQQLVIPRKSSIDLNINTSGMYYLHAYSQNEKPTTPIRIIIAK